MAEQLTIPIKIIMVGAMNVGKTSLVTKFATGKTPGQTKTTKNASYVSKRKNINGLNFEIKLWDTAGQEKYKSLTKLFTKEAKIAILVYAIDSEESFNELNDWLKLVKSTNEDNIILGVAANKSDLASESTISEQRGQEYAKSIGAVFQLTSCVENIGIDDLFQECGDKYFEENKLFHKTETIKITKDRNNNKKNKKKKCC